MVTYVGVTLVQTCTITRLTLPDAPAAPTDRHVAWAIERRWNPDSPLRRAAHAALAHLHQQGIDLSDIELAGYRLPTPQRRAGTLRDARWWINWKWRGYRSIPRCLADGDGWLEVLNPTRTRPLDTLLLAPGSLDAVRNEQQSGPRHEASRPEGR